MLKEWYENRDLVWEHFQNYVFWSGLYLSATGPFTVWWWTVVVE